MVLGATNRPADIDAAILRRMPKRYAVRLPDRDQRRKILDIMLADIRLDANFDMNAIVKRTEGFSGSDLKEACRNAAMQPVREFIRSSEGREKMVAASKTKEALAKKGGSGTVTPSAADFQTRPIRNGDFFVNESVNGNRTLEEDPLD